MKYDHSDQHTLLMRFFSLISGITGKDYAAHSFSRETGEYIRQPRAGSESREPVPLSDRLASELFARLLLELPDHRRDLMAAYRENDLDLLARRTHKLLGAVMYCDLPELAAALQTLRLTRGENNAEELRLAYGRTISTIDHLLQKSGYRPG